MTILMILGIVGIDGDDIVIRSITTNEIKLSTIDDIKSIETEAKSEESPPLDPTKSQLPKVHLRPNEITTPESPVFRPNEITTPESPPFRSNEITTPESPFFRPNEIQLMKVLNYFYPKMKR